MNLIGLFSVFLILLKCQQTLTRRNVRRYALIAETPELVHPPIIEFHECWQVRHDMDPRRKLTRENDSFVCSQSRTRYLRVETFVHSLNQPCQHLPVAAVMMSCAKMDAEPHERTKKLQSKNVAGSISVPFCSGAARPAMFLRMLCLEKSVSYETPNSARSIAGQPHHVGKGKKTLIDPELHTGFGVKGGFSRVKLIAERTLPHRDPLCGLRLHPDARCSGWA